MMRRLVFCILGCGALVACIVLATRVSAEKAGRNELQPADTPIFVEDFNYSPGSLLTANGWTAHSAGGTNAIATVAPGLTLTGYPSSGVGNAVSMTTNGEDDNRTFTIQTAGSVYAAFMVNTSDAAIDAAGVGGYFFHFGPDPIGTAFRGRVFIQKNASNAIAFGISKAASILPDVAVTPFSYALNTTYLVVVKYTIVDGATNDTVALFVSPTVLATEPAPTISATDVIATDINPGSVALRQGSANIHPTVKVDGIRVGTTWASVTQTPTTPTADAPFDYTGDGKTDVSILRPSNGQWWIQNSATSNTFVATFGVSTDVLVPADYTGDGKDDIAFFRPASGEWFILRSQDSSFYSFPFGASGDIPVPGDFDNDNKDDPAIFRPSNLTWYILNSGGGTTITTFGVSGDLPVAADYDGDGKADVGIFRPSNGQWWINRSQAGLIVYSFGSGTDKALPGDYTGDGKADVAFWRPSTGEWYVLRSENASFYSFPFGISTDLPVPGDYDGDGKIDAAVFRGSNVTWFINGSTAGSIIQSFGAAGDRPTPNAYVR